MDRWKAKELKCMELGGNKNAQMYYEKNGMINADGKPNHQAAAHAKYKQDLARKVRSNNLFDQAEQTLGFSASKVTMVSAPLPKIEETASSNDFFSQAV